LTLRRLLPVFPGKQTFSAATPTGWKRFEPRIFGCHRFAARPVEAQGLPDTKVGIFTPALYAEAKKNWTVISMKNDWKKIFSFE
jgi:hypothetical protein